MGTLLDYCSSFLITPISRSKEQTGMGHPSKYYFGLATHPYAK